MEKARALDLHGILDHGRIEAVLRYAKEIFLKAYPGASFEPVDLAFGVTSDLYAGRLKGYCACRTGYHDYRHTVDVFIATLRLMDGGVLQGRGLPPDYAAQVLIGALLHDAGYVQEVGDEDGTGAKYTKTHVIRSAEFVYRHAADLGLNDAHAARVAHMILGTDLALPWASLEFGNSDERLAGEVLAAADLLGQMADRAYLEKLLFLYYEFKEAGIGGYDTAFDVLRKTSSFYKSIAGRLDDTLKDVSFDARVHFFVRHGEDRDLYRESIDKQMAYLDGIMGDNTLNFRKRLRRIDLEQVELAETRRLESLGVDLSSQG